MTNSNAFPLAATGGYTAPLPLEVKDPAQHSFPTQLGIIARKINKLVKRIIPQKSEGSSYGIGAFTVYLESSF